ncbi:MAG: sterol desaturase family protein [Methylococcales bacterium]|nr:sterol desaturase family protein [Methylococcales bacterium]
MPDSTWRLPIAIGVFLLIIAWEWLWPRRPHAQRSRRWPNNLGLALTNILVMRVSIGAWAVLTAQWTQAHAFGLIPNLPGPAWLHGILALLALDLAIYGQHIAAHRWPWLWRLHQVHHSDLMFDASTAVRFHPLEILLSMLYKSLCVLLLGAPVWTVVTFEIVLNAAATFNHGNIRLPAAMEHALRLFIITPDLHRIHHSTDGTEMNSNYGFSLSCWDRLFQTLTKTPKQPQTTLAIGLPDLRTASQLSFGKLLKLPWR